MPKLHASYENILNELTERFVQEAGLQKRNIRIEQENSEEHRKYRAFIKITGTEPPSLDQGTDIMSFELWATDSGSLCFESEKELVEYEVPREKKDLFDDVLFYYFYERDRKRRKIYQS